MAFMYCDVPIYAFPVLFALSAQQGTFQPLTLLEPLLPWFALVVAAWIILLSGNLVRRQQESTQALPWYLRVACTLLSFRGADAHHLVGRNFPAFLSSVGPAARVVD